MDNGEPINIFRLGSGREVCFLDKSLMRKYWNWIREALGVEQRELLEIIGSILERHNSELTRAGAMRNEIKGEI